MSAPLKDQRFVSTQDGSTWERKGYDREGAHGLYALAGSVEESPRLWSVRELAELGLRGMTDVLPMPVGRELTEVERLRARLAVVEGQRAALAERLRAGQTWQSGRLTGEGLVAPSELRELFAIPLAAPLNEAEADGITRRIAPTQALREDESGCPRNVIDGDVGAHFFKRGAFADSPIRCTYCGARQAEPVTEVVPLRTLSLAERVALRRSEVEDPHNGPLHRADLIPHDMPPLDGGL